MKIIVSYTAIDGCKKKGTYKTLKGARAFAHKWVGKDVSMCGWYAVSCDGIGKITVDGCTLSELFNDEDTLAKEAAMLAEMEEESAAREAYLRGDPVPPKKAPAVKYNFATVEEAEEAYGWAMESWGERYAEAGSSWVFGGGNPYDANLAASQAVGPKPTRAEFELPEPVFAHLAATPAKTPAPVEDCDIPF